jgi:hypothetical protein
VAPLSSGGGSSASIGHLRSKKSCGAARRCHLSFTPRSSRRLGRVGSAMLSGFFGGKKPAETPPSVGASYGSGADGTGTRAPASSAMGASGGASRTKSSGGNGTGNPDDIPDGDMAALFERCQDLLAKTMKRADIGAKTVRGRRTRPKPPANVAINTPSFTNYPSRLTTTPSSPHARTRSPRTRAASSSAST